MAVLTLGAMLVACSTDSKIDNPAEGENKEENVNPQPQPEPVLLDYYMLVKADKEDWSGDYLIACEKRGGQEVVFAKWQNHRYGQPVSGVDLSAIKENGKIPAEKVEDFKTVITKNGNMYSVHVSNVGYIGLENRHNLTYITEVPEAERFHWTISYDLDYEVVSIRNAETEGRQLLWNDAPDCFWFGCYSSPHDDIKALNVYERVTENK